MSNIPIRVVAPTNVNGANWNFIFWGLYYFVLLVIEKTFLLKYLNKGKIWPHLYTMFFVVVGWALFVGNDAGVSLGLLLQKMFVPSGGVSAFYFLRNYAVLLVVCVLCCTPLPLKLYDKLKQFTVLRGFVLGLILLITIAYMVAATNSPFLYFRF